MENADSTQKLFELVGMQLADPDIDANTLTGNLHALVRSGHVCASPIAVRILCEVLTNERICPCNWLLALDYARIEFTETESAAVNATIDEIRNFRDFVETRFGMRKNAASIAIPAWLQMGDVVEGGDSSTRSARSTDDDKLP